MLEKLKFEGGAYVEGDRVIIHGVLSVDEMQNPLKDDFEHEKTHYNDTV